MIVLPCAGRIPRDMGTPVGTLIRLPSPAVATTFPGERDECLSFISLFGKDTEKVLSGIGLGTPEVERPPDRGLVA